MELTKEKYRARYRALGRLLEIKRLRLGEAAGQTSKERFGRHRPSQKKLEGEMKDILQKIGELEDLLY